MGIEECGWLWKDVQHFKVLDSALDYSEGVVTVAGLEFGQLNGAEVVEDVVEAGAGFILVAAAFVSCFVNEDGCEGLGVEHEIEGLGEGGGCWAGC